MQGTIVMLMARLGVRGGEVASLVLEDIDWRAGEITVRGKGRELRLPLPHPVGEAVVAYLRDGRPAGVETRAVFVTRLPPVRAMGRAAIREEIARLSERAGLGRVNAHRLPTHACGRDARRRRRPARDRAGARAPDARDDGDLREVRS